MKQSAAKTLGVAALGAAFAAAGAGAASAAPSLPDAATAVDGATQSLTTEGVTQKVAPVAESLAAAQEMGTALAAGRPTVAETLPAALPGDGPAGQAGALLGGLPMNGLTANGL